MYFVFIVCIFFHFFQGKHLFCLVTWMPYIKKSDWSSISNNWYSIDTEFKEIAKRTIRMHY